jgi:ureidoglycolate hydrolase
MNEIWKDIKRYEWLYQVSSLWRVKTLSIKGSKKDRIMTWCKNRWYIIVSFSKNNIPNKRKFSVHRLVAQAFLWLDIDSLVLVVCHKDDNKSNNTVENLFIGTQADNIQDCVNKWRQVRWEKNRAAKLTNNNVIDIRKALKAWRSCKDIAQYYPVHFKSIEEIKYWNTWTHIQLT